MQTHQVSNHSSVDMDEQLNIKVHEVRNSVINVILFLFCTVGLLALCTWIYFIIFYYKTGWDYNLSFFVVCYLVFLITAINHKKLSYHIKSYIVLGLLFLLGTHSIINWSLVGNGIIYLCMFCIFAAVLFNTRTGLYASGITFLVMSIIGVLVFFGVIQYEHGHYMFIAKSPATWATTVIVTMLNLFCLIYSHGKFNNTLHFSIEMLEKQTSELKQEIVERNKVESALRESESKYRNLFESAGDSILLMKDDIIVDCNHKTCELFERDREEIIMSTPFELSPYHQEDGSISKEKGLSILNSLSESKLEEFEWVHTKGNKSIFYTEAHLSEMEFNNEKYILAILLDITDRKNAERKLFDEKNFSETVINSLPGIFFMYDEGKNLIRWNKNYEQVSGYSSVELGKMKAYDFVKEEDRAYIEHKFDEGFIEGTFRFEQNTISKNGESIPFDFIGRTIDVNNRTYILGLGFDLRARRAAEKALMASEKRFRELVETITIGISIVKDGMVVYMNPKQVSILGKYPESYEIKDMPFHPEDVSHVLKDYNALISGSIKTFEHEVRLMQYRKVTDKRNPILVFCNGSRISYMGEVAVLITMVDITKTRELEQLVHLREKMVSLGHVAAGIAHEIRNPLSGINILVDGIREDFEDEENTERIKKDIVEIQKASNKISAVIKRVLDFSRPGMPSLALSDVNLPINEAVELSTVTLKKEGVVISARLAVNLPKIQVDKQAMEQVILNLITNAANAMRDIEGEKNVEVVSWIEDDEVFITVSDSGKGITDELKEKIFDPFFTTRSDGSGIGLSLCQRIITDHSGTIHVYDSELGGAEFKIKLPVQKG